MSAAPACIVTAAIALALVGGCAVAPSPAPSASPAASRPSATAAPSVLVDAPLLVAWERRADEARLIVVSDGRVDRRPLPAVPNGPLVAGTHGPLAYLSGPPEQPVLWTGLGSLAEPEWDAQLLIPERTQDEPFVWVCLGPGTAPRAAVQSNDSLVHIVDAGGNLRLLPAGLLMLRPGGCMWSDARHVIVPTDAPRPRFHIGFAIFDVEDGTSRLLAGNGGEAPAASDVSLAYVAAGQAKQSAVWIVAIPGPSGSVPRPDVRVAPDSPELDLSHPVLSADGRRLAVVELARPAAPHRLLVYDLFPTPAIVMELDVRGAMDVGPAWVANRPQQ